MRYAAGSMAVVAGLTLACGGGEAPPEAPVEEPAPVAEPEPPPPPPAPKGPAVPLAALVATSRAADAALLLDGDPDTRWVPEGDASLEGVLLRFEKPGRVRVVTVKGCDGAKHQLSLYGNGDLIGSDMGEDVRFELPDGFRARSLFLKLERGEKACFAEIEVEGEDGPIRPTPPRTVEARIDVSSTLEPVAAYHATYLFDGRPHFAWVEGAKGKGDGESIQITFRNDQTLIGFDLWNGYQRSDDHFEKNAKVRKLQVEAEGRRVMFDVAAESGRQSFDIDPPVSTRLLTLTIASATKGTAYEDMVISEIRLRDRQGPFTVRPLESPGLQEGLEKSLAGKPLGEVVGRTFRPACPDMDRQFKLRWDHSFVYYQPIDESLTEIMDGAWVPTKEGAKLYGRVHRVETEWQPYGESKEEASERVAGGDIAIATFKELGKEGVMEMMARFAKAGANDRVSCLMDGKKPDPEKLKALREKGEVIVVEGKAIMDVLVHDP